MEEVVKKGLAKNIGVSNFSAPQIAQVLEKCSVVPATNQVLPSTDIYSGADFVYGTAGLHTVNLPELVTSSTLV